MKGLKLTTAVDKYKELSGKYSTATEIEVCDEPSVKHAPKTGTGGLIQIAQDDDWYNAFNELCIGRYKSIFSGKKEKDKEDIKDIHWMSNVYLAAIIRDYLRFFIQNTAAVGNYVYEHNPEGYDYWEAEEKLDTDEMFHRWQKIVNGTADMFDELVKSVEIEETNEEYQKKVNVAFDALKEIFYDLEW